MVHYYQRAFQMEKVCTFGHETVVTLIWNNVPFGDISRATFFVFIDGNVVDIDTVWQRVVDAKMCYDFEVTNHCFFHTKKSEHILSYGNNKSYFSVLIWSSCAESKSSLVRDCWNEKGAVPTLSTTSEASTKILAVFVKVSIHISHTIPDGTLPNIPFVVTLFEQ